MLSKAQLSKDPREQNQSQQRQGVGLQLIPGWLASSGLTFTRTAPGTCTGRRPHKPCELGFTLFPLHR